jgi:hypothetical protein
VNQRGVSALPKATRVQTHVHRTDDPRDRTSPEISLPGGGLSIFQPDGGRQHGYRRRRRGSNTGRRQDDHVLGFWDWPIGGIPFVGALCVLLDGQGRMRAIIET